MIETVDAIIDNRQGRVTFDLQDIPPETTNFGIVQLGGDNPSKWIGGKLETINDDNLTRCFWVTGLGVHAVDGIELITQKLGPEPSTRMAVTGANNLPFIVRWTWKHRGGGGSEGMTETFLESATVNTERLRWLDRGDPKVFARLYINGDPALRVKPDNFTLPDLPIGNHVGQTLLISVTADPHSSGTGSKTLTLRHGTGFRLLLPSGGTLVLSAEQGVALSWTGTVWAMCA